MNCYPDETLNHWADVYVSRRVRGYGISLEAFLAYPQQMLARIERVDNAAKPVNAPVPPRRALRAEHELRQRGQVLMQKLWHGSRRRGGDAPLSSRR